MVPVMLCGHVGDGTGFAFLSPAVVLPPALIMCSQMREKKKKLALLAHSFLLSAAAFCALVSLTSSHVPTQPCRHRFVGLPDHVGSGTAQCTHWSQRNTDGQSLRICERSGGVHPVENFVLAEQLRTCRVVRLPAARADRLLLSLQAAHPQALQPARLRVLSLHRLEPNRNRLECSPRQPPVNDTHTLQV